MVADLKLLFSLDLNSFPVCSEEIVQYVKTVNPAGTEGSSPRFSLYLSAMLTHGAIIAHHKQVSHTLGKLIK
jgi:meiotic recombination protein REC8